MKKSLFLSVLLLSVTCLVCKAEVNVAVSINKGGNSFYLSIGDYFQVPQREVIVVRDRHIPDDEIPVVFYIARQTRIAPATIINLRLQGKSWMEITLRYGYGAEIFYFPVYTTAADGPPYGHAYGYYKNKPKKQWHKMKLEDADIVNLVNLKFMSEHYNYPAESIIKMRQGNKDFYKINDDIDRQRKENKKNKKTASPKKEKADYGQSNKPEKMKKEKKSEQMNDNKKQEVKANKSSNNENNNNKGNKSDKGKGNNGKSDKGDRGNNGNGNKGNKGN